MNNQQILKNTNAKLLDEFNASVMFDKELYAQDIKGSIAHSKMLALQNIISLEDQKQIENGLLQVKDEIENANILVGTPRSAAGTIKIAEKSTVFEIDCRKAQERLKSSLL